MTKSGLNSEVIPAWRNDSGLAGNHVVVTGAGGEIGRATAVAFAEAGALVVAVDLTAESLDDTLDQLPGSGHVKVVCDLADLSSHQEIFRQATLGAPMAAVAHLAAVLIRRDTIDEITEEDWDIQHSVNLKASFFLNRTARDVFVKQGTKGSIVNFSSQGWWTGGFGGSVVYAAAKGGVVSMTRGLARSFAADGVRVNVVAPGGVDTTMLHGGQGASAVSAFISMVPMGRLGTPEEMAGAVLFLASDASSYMTGALLNISGGQLMY
jgi:NAD(P)-dependent dehydrogenase (short-subunit alcohol dehydrogenase family)